jgi:hypothetical protein
MFRAGGTRSGAAGVDPVARPGFPQDIGADPHPRFQTNPTGSLGGQYVSGSVRHADHKTIVLHGWHRVLMNTEGQAVAMRNVAFLD